jgi:hypothetical protein
VWPCGGVEAAVSLSGINVLMISGVVTSCPAGSGDNGRLRQQCPAELVSFGCRGKLMKLNRKTLMKIWRKF